MQMGPSANSVAQNTELKYSCGLASYIVTNTPLLEVWRSEARITFGLLPMIVCQMWNRYCILLL